MGLSPLSSMKTIVRPCFWAFFKGGPGLLLPPADRFLVALAGLADGPLRAPVQRAQQFPDVTFVVAHPETVFEQPCHPRTAPQRGREAVGFRAFEKEGLQLCELRLAQQWLAAGAPGFGQTGLAAFAVSPHPTAHALLRRFDSPRRLALAEPFFHDQPYRLDAPPL